MVWLPYRVCVLLCGIDKMSQLTCIQGKHFPDHGKYIISCQRGDKVGGGQVLGVRCVLVYFCCQILYRAFLLWRWDGGA